jgi:hypothetical protein
VKKESLRVPPKAVFTSLRRLLIAGRLERACLRGEENGWGKRKILNLPAVETLALESAQNQRKRES